MTTNDSAPRISVVMPVRDGEAYLAEAIESILAQTFADFEFIIVDDGSRDGTPAILSAFAKRDRRIRLHRIEGQGIVAALNLGIAESRGEFIARMDADDIALPHRFAAQIERMVAEPQLIALGSGAIKIHPDGRDAGPSKMVTSSGDIRAEMASRCALIHPTVIARRAALVEVGGYRRAFSYAEDYDLWLRLTRLGPLANIVEPLLKLRGHATQTSRVKSIEQRGAAALARAVHLRDDQSFAFDPQGSSGEAMRNYLVYRDRSPKPVERGEAKDLAAMLRAASRLGVLDQRKIQRIGRRIVAEGNLSRGWLLPLKLWLRR